MKMRKDVRRNLEQVLRAAHELFAERGAEVAMEDVARRAGVGVVTIYRRFGSKERLWAAVSAAACTDSSQCIHRATGAASDPIARLGAFIATQCQQSEQLAAL